MPVRVAINGFGRIGRNVLRSSMHRTDVEFVHINDLTSADMLAYLLQHDTVHGRFGEPVSFVDGALHIGDSRISVSSERNPANLPWAEHEVDVVLECTGVFLSGEAARAHLDAGARKVVISAPAKGVDATVVYGVNNQAIGSGASIVSNASCTTNCLAPVAKVLNDSVGIEVGMMTTVHSYTMDQNLLDAPHRKGKFRRARAAAQNMVPTTTGAAVAVSKVLPELEGRLSGMAIRVPTPNCSLVDLVFNAGRDTSVEEINRILIQAAGGSMAGVLSTTDAPVVSSDMIGNPHSSIVDLSCTAVSGRMVKVLVWYDNEWGFSNRMIDLAVQLGETA